MRKLIALFVLVAGIGSYLYLQKEEEPNIAVDSLSRGSLDVDYSKEPGADNDVVDEFESKVNEPAILTLDDIKIRESGIKSESIIVDDESSLLSVREQHDLYLEENPMRLKDDVANTSLKDRNALHKVIDSLPPEKRLEFLRKLQEILGGDASTKTPIVRDENGNIDYEAYFQEKIKDIKTVDDLEKESAENRIIILDSE